MLADPSERDPPPVDDYRESPGEDEIDVVVNPVLPDEDFVRRYFPQFASWRYFVAGQCIPLQDDLLLQRDSHRARPDSPLKRVSMLSTDTSSSLFRLC
jgi:hypothetical protein